MKIIIGWEDSALALNMVTFLDDLNVTARILSPTDFLENQVEPSWEYMVSVNQDPALRSEIIAKLDTDNLKRIKSVVHHTSYLANSAIVEPGTFVFPFCTIANNSVVEKDCVIAPYCMIGHRARLGQGSVMQPGSLLGGSSIIGKFCVFNQRSTVLDKLEICNNVVIGAGAMVTKNITEPGRYIGSPARKR